MGKVKRATRKELEKVVGEIIKELQSLRTAFIALDNYVGLYIEWKGDKIEFPDYIQKKFNEPEKGSEAPSVEGNRKSEKQSRYKKISTPL